MKRILTFKEYKEFYSKYYCLIDHPIKGVILNNEQLIDAYKKYEEKYGTRDLTMKQVSESTQIKVLERPLNEQEDPVVHEYNNKIARKENELTTTQYSIEKVGRSITQLIIEKNKRYGNSALKPLEIFSKHIIPKSKEEKRILALKERAFNQILTRLDDKLSRIKNAKNLRKNDVSDVLGYLMLICVNQGWEDFSDLID